MTVFLWGTLVFSGLAAVLWFYASSAIVPPGQIEDKDYTAALIIRTDARGREMDVIETAVKQSRWNARAAVAAGVAATCQVLQVLT